MMRNLLRIGGCLLTLLAPLRVNAQQNPSLNGEPGRKTLGQVNPFTTPQDLQKGASLFATHCSYCHGAQGEGGRGADLTAGIYRLGGSDAELYNTVRGGVPGSEMPPVKATDEETWKIVAFVKQLGSAGMLEKAPGDAAAGKALYDKSGCVSCHSINKSGGSLGPDLTDIGRRRGLKFLEEALVKPEADIPILYRAVQVVTSTGQTITGIRLNEDDLSIQIKDTSNNPRSLLKTGIKEIRYDKPSLMPPYGQALGKKGVEDVVAYLNSLKGAQ